MIWRRQEHRTNGYTTEELGRLIARAHYQAWRLDAPPFDLTPEELAAILPNLIRSGSAGIVWHRVKPVRERYGAMAYALEAATEAQIAYNQKVEEAVVECVTRLRAHGIEPVLVKGLALTKPYPEGIIRPAGDIDLVVRKHEFAAAHAILHNSTMPAIPIAIDLKHPSIWDEIPNDGFWTRLISMRVGPEHIDVLDSRDNKLMVCFHFLKHGGARPLWLSDVAITQQIVGDSEIAGPVRQNWMLSASSLAARLYGAQPIPSLNAMSYMPRLESAVIKNWLTDAPPSFEAARHLKKHPQDLVEVLRARWPDPVLAIIRSGASLDNDFGTRWQVRHYFGAILAHIRYRLWDQLTH